MISAALIDGKSREDSDIESGKFKFTAEQEECFEKMRSLYEGTDGLKW